MTAQTFDRPNNGRTLIVLLLIIACMIGLVWASVPLYRLFCAVTGYGGTTQQAAASSDIPVLDREMTIRFNADINPALPWQFKPVQKSVRVKIGEEALIFYRAVNDSDETVTGTATFNVTPFKAGSYFSKIECFCFTEQTLKPGEEVDMPVTFYIDPELAEDEHLDEVKEITLSYTFYRSDEEE
ncbi:cytochrome c oxidase assembly protein [Emcibacter sp.]|uniref:cytochrome c oxidase assembly protein n=1 Tax=Emcibacter sp. TaxID=1979954 RepID=UPI003A8D3713